MWFHISVGLLDDGGFYSQSGKRDQPLSTLDSNYYKPSQLTFTPSNKVAGKSHYNPGLQAEQLLNGEDGLVNSGMSIGM